MTKLKIVFAGTPDFAAKHLQALIESKHEIIAVYTMPDKPAGRGKNIQFSQVKQLALKYNISVYQPESLKIPENQEALAQLNPDIVVVVAYGMILPLEILNIPKLGCINVHGSLLPRWRGAAPIQRAIWAGDKTTGITIMKMDVGLDTGDILYNEECTIDTYETSSSLYDKLATIGPNALLKVLNNFDSFIPEQQNTELATYAKKLTKEEGKLDWRLSAIELERYIRAFIPFPYAYLALKKIHDKNEVVKILKAEVISEQTTIKAGTVIKIDKSGLQIATGDGILNILLLQPAGKKPMLIQDFLNGRPHWFLIGDVLE